MTSSFGLRFSRATILRASSNGHAFEFSASSRKLAMVSATDIGFSGRADSRKRAARRQISTVNDAGSSAGAQLVERHADFHHRADIVRRRRAYAIPKDVGTKHEIIIASPAVAVMHEMIAVDGFHILCAQQKRDEGRSILLPVIE